MGVMVKLSSPCHNLIFYLIFLKPVTIKSVALTSASFEDASKLTRRFVYIIV